MQCRVCSSFFILFAKATWRLDLCLNSWPVAGLASSGGSKAAGRGQSNCPAGEAGSLPHSCFQWCLGHNLIDSKTGVEFTDASKLGSSSLTWNGVITGNHFHVQGYIHLTS